MMTIRDFRSKLEQESGELNALRAYGELKQSDVLRLVRNGSGGRSWDPWPDS